MSNNDSANGQQGQGDVLRDFESAVDRLFGHFMRTIATEGSDSEDTDEDIDTSDMPSLENIPNATTTASNTTTPPTTTGSSSGMDIDQTHTHERDSGSQNAINFHDGDMPGLLAVSDSEDSDAEDVEMLVIDGASAERSHSDESVNMPALEPIPRLPPQQTSQQSTPSLASTPIIASNMSSQVPSASGPHNRRRAYAEGDPGGSDMPPPPEPIPSQSQTDNESVRVGSRRARVDDDDEDNGRRSMRSTNSATPAPPPSVSAPASRVPTPSVPSSTPNVPNNAPNTHPNRPIRPLPRNGPPPHRVAFDAILRQLFTVGGFTPAARPQTGNANAANRPAGDGEVNADTNTQPAPQPRPNAQPAANSTPGTADNGSDPAQNQEGQPEFGIDMFYHFIGPDGTVRTHYAGSHGQGQAQPQNGEQPQPPQGAGQEQNNQPNPGANANTNANANANRGPGNGVPRGFGGVLEQFLQALMFQNAGTDYERTDPERAKKLVSGLEIVPEGLVKRLERVGGAPGTHEDMPGDPGCAVCWDSLLNPEGEESTDDVKKEDVKEKSTEVTAESVPEVSLTGTLPSSEQAAASPRPVVSGIYYQCILLPNGLLFALPIFVLDSAAASASAALPAPDPPELPLPDVASDTTSSADSKKSSKEDEWGSKIVELPCAHVFHAKCLIPWFSRPNQTTCPVCRFNIDPENLTNRRSVQFRSQAPSPSPNLARAQAVPLAQAQAAPQPPQPIPAARQEIPAHAPQPQPRVADDRPTSPQAQPAHAPTQPQAGPQPQRNTPQQARQGLAFGLGGNPTQFAGGSVFSVNFDLVADNNPSNFIGLGNVFGMNIPLGGSAEDTQPLPADFIDSLQREFQLTPDPAPAQANAQPTQAEGLSPGNGTQQGAQQAARQAAQEDDIQTIQQAAQRAAEQFIQQGAQQTGRQATQRGAQRATQQGAQQGVPPRAGPQFVPPMPPFTFPPNFFPGMGAGVGVAFGMGRGVPQASQPEQLREPKEWTIPPAPGMTLRQRVEKKEREAGLRCSDISCGIGPTDEDPTPEIDSSLTDALKQISISRDDVEVKEPVCEHRFHPSCLVSAGRIAGWGQHEDALDEVEVSCPVCRRAGHIDRSQWDSGVRTSMA